MGTQSIMREGLKRGMLFYERRFSPFIATRCWFLLWPFYRIFKSFNICFVVNIAGGAGHIICELDQFFRRKKLGEIDGGKKYVWIRKGDVFSKACVKLYGSKFSFAACSYVLFLLLHPILIRFKEITLDSGLSRLKWQLDKQNRYFRPISNQTYLWQISKKEGLELWVNYYRKMLKTSRFFPLKETEFDLSSLDQILKGRRERIALIHLKDSRRNATALETDPKTYLKGIEYLIGLGFQLIFVGREKMPEIFNRLPIFNYAESEFANFYNDIALFNLSELSITSGSGIAFLAECYDRPYLYVNSWQLPMAMFSSKCIKVPTLIEKSGAGFLTFKEQMDLYASLPDQGEERLPGEIYRPRNADEEEIFLALKELMEIKERPVDKSPLQERFRQLGQGMPLYYSESRVSQAFLEKYKNLL